MGRWDFIVGWTGIEHVVAGELSLTDRAALAGVVRWEWLPLAAYEQALSLRAYSTGFDNPYARAISAPSLTEGKRTRNEIGLRWSSRWVPLKGLDVVSRLDLYRPFGIRAELTSGDVRFLEGGRWDLEWTERVSYKLTKKELLSVEWRFKDKELGVSGRNQAYYDDIDSWGDISAEGLGIDPALYEELAAEGGRVVRWLRCRAANEHWTSPEYQAVKMVISYWLLALRAS